MLESHADGASARRETRDNAGRRHPCYDDFMSHTGPTNRNPTIERHIEQLRRTLTRNDPVERPASDAVKSKAAVLVPLLERKGDLSIVYIRRSDHVESHRGQVAFPGGRVDPADRTLLDTALREAREEVGLAPEWVEVLGGFSTMSTLTSGMAVAPFVGLVTREVTFRPDPNEVAEVFEVPLGALSDPRYRGSYEWKREGAPASSYPAILYGGQIIWGLTLRITERLLEIIGAA